MQVKSRLCLRDLLRRSCVWVSEAQNCISGRVCATLYGDRARRKGEMQAKSYSCFSGTVYAGQVFEKSQGKGSFWKCGFWLFAKVSWKTLVLGGFVPSFLGKSRGKRLFWKESLSLVENACFGKLRGKRLFWKCEKKGGGQGKGKGKEREWEKINVYAVGRLRRRLPQFYWGSLC